MKKIYQNTTFWVILNIVVLTIGGVIQSYQITNLDRKTAGLKVSLDLIHKRQADWLFEKNMYIPFPGLTNGEPVVE